MKQLIAPQSMRTSFANLTQRLGSSSSTSIRRSWMGSNDLRYIFCDFVTALSFSIIIFRVLNTLFKSIMEDSGSAASGALNLLTILIDRIVSRIYLMCP